MEYSILLADEDTQLADTIEAGSEEYDLQLTHLTSGADTLLRIKELHPDILVVNTELPGVDGYSLVDIVSRETDLAGMRIVLTSGDPDQVDQDRIAALTTDGFLAKPFDAEALLVHLGYLTVEPEDDNVFEVDVTNDVQLADLSSLQQDGAEAANAAPAQQLSPDSEMGRRLVEQIVASMSDKVVREVAWEVVPDLAERMIREAIEKITR